MASDPTTAQALREALTDELLALADDKGTAACIAAHVMHPNAVNAEELQRHAYVEAVRAVLIPALLPLIEAREQAIREDERRKGLEHRRRLPDTDFTPWLEGICKESR